MSRRLGSFFDIESTGLSQPDGDRIIEIAAHIYDMDTRAKVGRFSQRINPQRAIHPDAEKVHGIKFEDLVAEPLWDEVGPKFAKVMGACRYGIAHNGLGFDFPFIWREFIRIGVAPPQLIAVDTMVQGRWATPDGAVPNLKALCFACGVPYDTTLAHAADYDVERMALCFFDQLDRGFFKLPTEYYVLPPLSESKGKK
jgi:DNA polymerase-3 subunit epsilon